MYELKKIAKVFTSKFVGTGPSSYEKKNLPGRSLTKVEKHWFSRILYPWRQKTCNLARDVGKYHYTLSNISESEGPIHTASEASNYKRFIKFVRQLTT